MPLRRGGSLFVVAPNLELIEEERTTPSAEAAATPPSEGGESFDLGFGIADLIHVIRVIRGWV